ncbi:MAG: hypothetical protein AB1Z23_11075 [Eubacteriales bacterium]
MNITIVKAIGDEEYAREHKGIMSAIDALQKEHQVDVFDADKMQINACTGCWTCWVKEPGKCVFDDDMVDIYKSIVKSDKLIFVSKIKAGFVQKEIRKVTERMFATLLPYITVLKDEFHHFPRYDKQAKLGLVVVGEEEHDTEQEEILKEYMYRLSLNFNKATGNFVHYFSAGKEKELVNEINNI